jgi:hypothetical protein
MVMLKKYAFRSRKTTGRRRRLPAHAPKPEMADGIKRHDRPPRACTPESGRIARLCAGELVA